MSTNYLFGQSYQAIGRSRHMTTLAENLAKYRNRNKLSQAKLAEKIGVRQNTIAAIESGLTKRTKFLPELAVVLGVSTSELDPNIGPNETEFIPRGRLVGENDLPVYASVEAGNGDVLVSSEPVQTVKRPEPLATVRGGYGVIVVGESMSPVVRPGDTVLVHPHLPPQNEDICLFMSGTEQADFKATLKEYIGQTKDLWKIRCYGPSPKDFTLKKRDWPRCEVVVGVYRRR